MQLFASQNTSRSRSGHALIPLGLGIYFNTYVAGSKVERIKPKVPNTPIQQAKGPCGLKQSGNRRMRKIMKMPINIVLGLLLLMLNACQQNQKPVVLESPLFDTVFVTNQDINKSYEVGAYLNGKKDGLWKVFNSEGYLRSKTEYREGIKHGIFVFYHLNDSLTLSSFGRYQNGNLNGPLLRFFPNGQLSNYEFYHKGKLNGENRVWDLRGNLLSKSRYRESKLDGIQLKFCPYSGDTLRISEYDMGQLLFKTELRKDTIDWLKYSKRLLREFNNSRGDLNRMR